MNVNNTNLGEFVRWGLGDKVYSARQGARCDAYLYVRSNQRVVVQRFTIAITAIFQIEIQSLKAFCKLPFLHLRPQASDNPTTVTIYRDTRQLSHQV